MRALLLAAGVGNRLQGAGHVGPKILLAFDGRSLLARHVSLLRAAGIDDIVVATGFGADAIEAELRRLPQPGQIRMVHNSAFRQGSAVTYCSLGAAATAGGDILLMDGDVLYDRRILDRLLATRQPECFLLDRDFEPGEEPMKLAVKDDQLREFRRRLSVDFDYCGESVGFFRLTQTMAARLFKVCQEFIDAGRTDEDYETALGDQIEAEPGRFGFEDVTGLPWTEIDFPDDIVRARDEILPRLIDDDRRPD